MKVNLFTNGVGRPSNETIKKRNAFKGICAVLVLLILGLVGYILNDKGIINLANKKTNSSKVDVVTTTEKVKEEILADEEGKKIVESVFGKFSGFSFDLNDNMVKTFAAIINIEEGKEKYTCKDLFGNDLKRLEAYGEGSWQVEGLLCSDGYQTLYDYNEVNEQYQKMFGKSNNALKATIKENDDIISSAYGYSKLKNGYSFLSCECGDGFPVIDGFKNARKIENKIYVDYAYLAIDSDPNTEYFELNDGTKVKFDYSKIDKYFDIYKDKINTITTLVFEKKSDDSYIFLESK